MKLPPFCDAFSESPVIQSHSNGDRRVIGSVRTNLARLFDRISGEIPKEVSLVDPASWDNQVNCLYIKYLITSSPSID